MQNKIILTMILSTIIFIALFTIYRNVLSPIQSMEIRREVESYITSCKEDQRYWRSEIRDQIIVDCYRRGEIFRQELRREILRARNRNE